MTNNKHILIRETTEEEHRQTIETMERFLDIQDNPKVGVFFYDPNLKVLYGVVALLLENLINNQEGLVTVRTSHREIWDKAVRKQQEKYNGEGPFQGEYENALRGYVAYNPCDNVFECHVGDWFNKYPEALDGIIEEFDLSGCNHRVVIDRLHLKTVKK